MQTLSPVAPRLLRCLRNSGCKSAFTPLGVRSISTNPPSPSIYVSDSTDPYFNLAFEDWIFRKTDPNQIILYLYRNTPSVIIGRNQNPWKEINLRRLESLTIPFVRRKSGGGTVYHDLGNTNYCVYVPRLKFERNVNAEMVARALNGLLIPAQVNERNDICVEGFKVSGSAFKLVNTRAYHHGTMLIDAKLGDLRGVLGNDQNKMIAKGVASVSSAVRNLRDWSTTIDHEEFVEAVVDEFTRTYGGDGLVKRVNENEVDKNEYVKTVVEELKSWEWKYGQTPEFTNEISETFDYTTLSVKVKVRHAVITEIESEMEIGGDGLWKATLDQLCSKGLLGDRYSSLETTTAILDSNQDEGMKEKGSKILDWLRMKM